MASKPTTVSVPIAIYCSSSHLPRQHYATQLAAQLQLPIISSDIQQFSYLLTVTDSHLELQATAANYKPVTVDFLSPAAEYRRVKGGGTQQQIARAVGIKPNYRPSIIDATAGFGEDGYVLASLGCSVHYLERSPIIAALLQDGLARLLATTTQRLAMNLVVTDAISYLTTLAPDEYPDVIYLDPMFPTRTKSALVKKSMRILRDIVGYDLDADALLHIALQRAKKRVVVKRSRIAPMLNADIKPDIVLTGRSSRFDIYTVNLS